MPTLALTVNGQPVEREVPREATLLHLLRNDLGLNGPKYGCGLGQCGACTVHVDGVAARACVIPAHGVAGRSITTLEGLGNKEHWHPVQAAFEQAQAAQCGYCLNGMVMQTAALLTREPQPSEARVRAELSGNLCRCGTHVEILDAVARAAQLITNAQAGGNTLRLTPARESDLEALCTLRVAAMRESLEHIGRFDEARARRRLAAGFQASSTRHIEVGGERVGFVVVKPHEGALLLDHLYLWPAHQGRGHGSAVLAQVFREADGQGRCLRVGALKESRANTFYQRHGFTLIEAAEWDNYYERAPQPR